jgi:hypothetical protein
LIAFSHIPVVSLDPVALPILADWVLRVESVRGLVGGLALAARLVRTDSFPFHAHSPAFR